MPKAFRFPPCAAWSLSLVLLAACGQQPAAQAAPGAPQARIEGDAVFVGARKVLDGAASPLAADSLALRGRFRLEDRELYLVEGARGAACPAQYVVLEVGPGEAARASEPFGTCSDGASARLQGGALRIEMPRFSNVEAVSGAAGFTYSQGQVTEDAMTSRTTHAWPPSAGCPAYGGAGGLEQADRLMAGFEAAYPKALTGIETVDAAELSPAELRATVACLANLSGWPGADPAVADAAEALFRSRRYGGQALKIAQDLAADRSVPAAERSSAEAFARQMGERLRAPA